MPRRRLGYPRNIRFPPDLEREVEKLAGELKMSFSETVRVLVGFAVSMIRAGEHITLKDILILLSDKMVELGKGNARDRG